MVWKKPYFNNRKIQKFHRKQKNINKNKSFQLHVRLMRSKSKKTKAKHLKSSQQPWIHEWMHEWMNDWMNEWMNAWMHECMNEWFRLHTSTYIYSKNVFCFATGVLTTNIEHQTASGQPHVGSCWNKMSITPPLSGEFLPKGHPAVTVLQWCKWRFLMGETARPWTFEGFNAVDQRVCKQKIETQAWKLTMISKDGICCFKWWYFQVCTLISRGSRTWNERPHSLAYLLSLKTPWAVYRSEARARFQMAYLTPSWATRQ